MKKVLVAMMLGMGLIALGAGCGKSEGDGAAASGDSIGVAECDAYFKAVDACVAKNPAMKPAMDSSRKANHDAWKTAASTPQGKESLKTGCKAAADALKASCP